MEKYQKTSGKIQLLMFLMLCALAGVIISADMQQRQRKKDLAKKEAESLRVSVITDIDHCPSRESASLDNMDLFLNQAKSRNADLVVSLGDNASHRLQNCSLTADTDARFIADKLRSAGKPTYFVLGDHDIESSEESYRNWLATSQQDKTNYSFDIKGVHVVVFDALLGGESMSPPCEEREDCRTLLDRLSLLKRESFLKYRTRYPDAQKTLPQEKTFLQEAVRAKRQEINLTRSWGDRDIGRVSDQELEWLKNDLDNTPLSRVLIMSHQPLFPFATNKKIYNVVNGDKTRTIMEQSGKQIVCLSGDVHAWQEEAVNGVRYYVIDEFRKNKGSWAFFFWLPEGYGLEKIASDNKETEVR